MNLSQFASDVATAIPPIVAAAAAAAAVLPQPGARLEWAKARKIIDWLAMNFADAKNAKRGQRPMSSLCAQFPPGSLDPQKRLPARPPPRPRSARTSWPSMMLSNSSRTLRRTRQRFPEACPPAWRRIRFSSLIFPARHMSRTESNCFSGERALWRTACRIADHQGRRGQTRRPRISARSAHLKSTKGKSMKKLLCGALLLACVSPASAMSYFTGPNAATTVNDAAIVACDLSMVADVAVGAERAANAGHCRQDRDDDKGPERFRGPLLVARRRRVQRAPRYILPASPRMTR